MFVQEIRDTSESDRATEDFQVRVWSDTRLWPGGLIKRRGLSPKPFLTKGFRTWFAAQTVEILPENGEERLNRLSNLLDELLRRITATEDWKWEPWVEMLRTLALFFPEDFTALATRDWLVTLARSMDMPGNHRRPVAVNQRILKRLRDVLGPPSDGLEGTVERMLLPCELDRLIRRHQEGGRPNRRREEEEEEEHSPRLWVVRAGKHGEDEDYVLSQGMAMLGFRDEPSPEQDTYTAYLDRVVKVHDGWSKRKASSPASQVWAFARKIEEDDIVILPQKKSGGPKHIAWGTVDGDYEHRQVDGQHRHTRPVTWIRKDVPRSDFGEAVKSLDAGGTVFSVQKHAEQIQSVLDKSCDRTSFLPNKFDPLSVPSFGDIWTQVSTAADTQGVLFNRRLIETLHLGLWAGEQRHFAVLSGLSGSGKTQIARLYASALTGAERDAGGPVSIISVHPGWHDPGSLLGYLNPINHRYERTVFLNFLLNAVKAPSQPHVVILDEMNLSHPEQYFAPILSAMEIQKGEIPLHGGNAEELGVPTSVTYPANLFIIGTVNMDETTMGISDKVLDRAFTLEFWDIDPDRWPGWDRCALEPAEQSKVRAILTELTEALSPARRHFGWRVIKEVVGFLEGRSRDSGIELSAEAALDQVIYAKVLPKLRGSDTGRFRDCLDATKRVLDTHGLTRCAEKVEALKEDLDATGSCSFWR